MPGALASADHRAARRRRRLIGFLILFSFQRPRARGHLVESRAVSARTNPAEVIAGFGLPHHTSRQGLRSIHEAAEPFKRFALMVIIETLSATSGLLKRSGSIPRQEPVSTSSERNVSEPLTRARPPGLTRPGPGSPRTLDPLLEQLPKPRPDECAPARASSDAGPADRPRRASSCSETPDDALRLGRLAGLHVFARQGGGGDGEV